MRPPEGPQVSAEAWLSGMEIQRDNGRRDDLGHAQAGCGKWGPQNGMAGGCEPPDPGVPPARGGTAVAVEYRGVW